LLLRETAFFRNLNLLRRATKALLQFGFSRWGPVVRLSG